LLLLLKKSVNRRNPATGRYAIDAGNGLSFKGRRYVSPGLLARLRGKSLEIYYDRRDIRVIFLFVEGVHVGEAYCPELMARGRTSEWEAAADRRATAEPRRAANAEGQAGLRRVLEKAESGRKAHRVETARLEKARQLDLQLAEIHPPAVQAVLRAIQVRLADPVEQPGSSDHLTPAVPDDRIIPLRRPAIRPRGGGGG
jgi:hypothetical protein